VSKVCAPLTLDRNIGQSVPFPSKSALVQHLGMLIKLLVTHWKDVWDVFRFCLRKWWIKL